MTLDELPGPLTDADLVRFDPLEVVLVDDLKPTPLQRLLSLPTWILLLPVRIVQGLIRRPKLLAALVVGAIASGLTFRYLSRRDRDSTTA